LNSFKDSNTYSVELKKFEELLRISVETATPEDQIIENSAIIKVNRELSTFEALKEGITAATSLAVPPISASRNFEHQTKSKKIDEYPGFKESCWILLTGQKPCSASTEKGESS
jgi:hypothetical protein